MGMLISVRSGNPICVVDTKSVISNRFFLSRITSAPLVEAVVVNSKMGSKSSIGFGTIDATGFLTFMSLPKGVKLPTSMTSWRISPATTNFGMSVYQAVAALPHINKLGHPKSAPSIIQPSSLLNFIKNRGRCNKDPMIMLFPSRGN
ncbi:hypothetical protein HNY73_016612 [Argiope bruennichi]|uniref:Uncharacterized protein n=1 Tax=Argiope bruennichi TaxID=94029 RepID=A0A8T0EP98_ARGBR|nr:hypothetical protein HNY73_016612 [Argiope bruennichi]